MLTALAVFASVISVHLVQAQCSGSKTILTNDDSTTISQCSTFEGDIIIDVQATGDIDLNGIQNITGSFTAANVDGLTSLNADSLTYVGGTLQLSGLPLLHDFNFSYLEHAGHLSMASLPMLQDLSFDTGLAEFDSLEISSTSLISLSGITPVVIGTIDVSNNTYLETVDFNSLVNATGSLSFKANAPNMIAQFESLQFVDGDFVLQNISGLSLPDLQGITGNFTCHSCPMVTFRSTWLQTVGGTLAFADTDLQDLQFPDLTTVGGDFQLSNNAHLDDLSGFPMLESVQGSMTLDGVMNSIDFSSLGLVLGNVNISTTSSNQTICDTFDDLRNNRIVRGTVSCLLYTSNPANNNDSVPSSTNSSTALSTGAIAGLVIGIIILLALTSLAIFFVLRRRNRHVQTRHREIQEQEQQQWPETSKSDTNIISYVELPGSRHEGKAELYVDPRDVAEMKGAMTHAVEIDSQNEKSSAGDGGGTRRYMGSSDAGSGMSANFTARRTKEVPGVFEVEGNTGPDGSSRNVNIVRPTTEEGNSTSARSILSPVSPISPKGSAQTK